MSSSFMFRSGSLYVPPEKEQVVKEPKKKSEKREREVVKEAVAPQEMTTEETNEVTFSKDDYCSLQKSHSPFINE